ncbi:MAG: mechanosensitive ion channel [Candidatus Omnitrophica bacterium]|nr:mechanosensitive ion channel [Candidatus Omnitrophota bacterium]
MRPFSPEVTVQVVQTAVTIGIIYIFLFLIIRIINRAVSDVKSRYKARQATFYTAHFIILLILAAIWMENVRNLGVVIGAVGAGLTLALQEVILSFAGWLLIVFRKPFDTGDRIEFGKVKGDVIDIRIFQTSLLEIGNWVKADQSTGRIVHLPNSTIFREPVFNYSRGFEFIWNEISVVVTFESNWERAREIMLEQAQEESEKIKDRVNALIRKMSMRYLIYYQKLTPIVYTKIIDSGVELTLRYLIDVKKRRTTEDAIARGILQAFHKEPGIDFAYTTYRIVRIPPETCRAETGEAGP